MINRGPWVDSSVMLDVLTEDAAWMSCSSTALVQARDAGRLVINPIVYTQISTGFERVEDLDAAVSPDDFDRETLPYQAGFVAGTVLVDYQRGGKRRLPLPDFYIGALAAVRRYRVLARDASRYRTYFPTIELITSGNDR